MKTYTKKIIDQVNNPEISPTPGVVLVKLCLQLNYSVAELAGALEITRATVYNWVAGRSQPSSHLKSKVANLTEKLRARLAALPGDEDK